ncbi:MAG: tetratricopeptide repeat protein [Clostridiales bacterium]|jgi:tetratricopeptide (TPR) repeat protein|nr:tetratricopeptide repeat protein [Clostridiales bacterium]
MIPALSNSERGISQALKISVAHYNTGLARAKSQDITGVIDSLTKSLMFDKSNVDAHNLLGLALYEIGRLGEAIKEWRISVALRPTDNFATHYLDELRKNSRHVARVKDAISMYNLALDYLRQNSDDMAIIQLKKAVDINPHFVDALDLLSLAYLQQNDNYNALSMVERALSVDVNNPIALSYYHKLQPGRTRPPILKAGPKSAPLREEFSLSRLRERSSFAVAGIVAFVIGVLSALAIMYVLIMPAATDNKNSEIERLKETHASEISRLQTELDDYDIKTRDLTTQMSALEEYSENLKSQMAVLEINQRIAAATALFDSGNFQEALDAVSAIDAEGLASDLIEQVDTIKNEAPSRLFDIHFSAARGFYNVSNYESARPEYESALRFMPADSELADDLLYYLGRSCQLLGDDESAIAYYHQLIEDYSDMPLSSNARSRLRNLE